MPWIWRTIGAAGRVALIGSALALALAAGEAEVMRLEVAPQSK